MATNHLSNHPLATWRGDSDEQTQAEYHQLTSQEKWQIVAFIYYSILNIILFSRNMLCHRLRYSAAFNQYPAEKLVRLCALQLVAYREVLKNNGGNQYRMPHTAWGIRNRQKSKFEHRHNTLEDCGDYDITADLVLAAVRVLQYEKESGQPFPWNQHPNYEDDIEAAHSPAPHEDEVFEYLSSPEAFDDDDDADDRSIESDDSYWTCKYYYKYFVVTGNN